MSDEHRTPSHLPQPMGHGYDVTPAGYTYPAQAQYSYPAGAGGDGGDGFDLRRMAAVLWARKWWILGITVLAIAGGVLGARYLIEPVYETRATVWLDTQDGRGGPIRGEDVFQGEGWASLMRSHAVLKPVVQRRSLYVTVLEPRGVGRDLFQEFRASEDMLTGDYKLELAPDGSYRLIHEKQGVLETGRLGEAASIGHRAGFEWWPDPAALEGIERIRFELVSELRASLRLRSSLNTRYDGRANLIHGTITWNDPAEAAAILNDVVEGFIQVAHELQNRKLAEVVGILERQTGYAAEELRQKEMALESFRVDAITEPTEPQAGAVPGGPGTRGAVVGTYFDQRLEARQLESDVEQIQRMLEQVRGGDTLNAFALQQIPSLGDAPELRAAVEELYEKEAQRRALTYTYTPDHPDVRELTQEIQELRQQEIPAIVTSLMRQLQNRRGVLDEQLTAQARELRQIPPRAIEETRRQREFQMAQELHNRLLSRLREAQLAQATNLSDLQVVDEATVPFGPTRNDAPRIIMMAAMAGFGLAIGGVLLFDRMDSRIRYPEQITHRLGLPVLGMVPRLSNGKKGQPQLAAVAIESFRSIRTQIVHAGGPSNRVVLITSPAPRDGKSMIAANLAISFASAGKRTILVDADTRRGRAEEMFGLARSPGLMEYLCEEAEKEEVTRTTQVDNLAFIARGDRSHFNAELLASRRMDDLVEGLREEFEMVVLDGPPLAAGADALLLGELSDKVVLVVRAGATDEEMARTKLDMVGNVELPFVGAVLNAVPDTAPYYEYYANYYYAETA